MSLQYVFVKTTVQKSIPKKKQGKFTPGGFALKVRRSSAGLGLYAQEAIPKGACIIEYIGRELAPGEEFTITSQYLFEVTKKKTIDGSPRYNTARYINHSCRPNCEIEIYQGRVFVLAKRNIREGEELNYDYGEDFFDEYIKPKGCRCLKCKPVKEASFMKK